MSGAQYDDISTVQTVYKWVTTESPESTSAVNETDVSTPVASRGIVGGLVPLTLGSVGVIGNVVAIVVIAVQIRRRRQRDRDCFYYSLLLGLLAVDLLGIVLSTPLVLHAYFSDNAQFQTGTPSCEYFSVILLTFGLASEIMAAEMAVERYINVKHPMLRRRMNIGSWTAAKVVVATALVSLFVAMFPVMGVSRNEAKPPRFSYCFFITNGTHWDEYVYSITFSVSGILIILLIAFCNLSASVTLLQRSWNVTVNGIAAEETGLGLNRNTTEEDAVGSTADTLDSIDELSDVSMPMRPVTPRPTHLPIFRSHTADLMSKSTRRAIEVAKARFARVDSVHSLPEPLENATFRGQTRISRSGRPSATSLSLMWCVQPQDTSMLVFLVALTCVFTICWLPLLVRILINQVQAGNGVGPDHEQDLLVIRMASVNQILDPWVYILLRKEALAKAKRCFRRYLRFGRKRPPRSISLQQRSPLRKQSTISTCVSVTTPPGNTHRRTLSMTTPIAANHARKQSIASPTSANPSRKQSMASPTSANNFRKQSSASIILANHFRRSSSASPTSPNHLWKPLKLASQPACHGTAASSTNGRVVNL